MSDITAAPVAAIDEPPERHRMISHAYWLRYLADFRRWKLVAGEPPGDSYFLYSVSPIVHSACYTHDSRFGGQLKQRILAKPKQARTLRLQPGNLTCSNKNLFSGCDAERSGHARHLTGFPPNARCRRDMQLTGLSLRHIIARRSERAATVDRDDQPRITEVSHSATHCHPGHAVLLGQVYLARQPRIRGDQSGPDVFLDVPGNLGSDRYGRIVSYPVRSVIQCHVDHGR
jgi:hypothetical protein